MHAEAVTALVAWYHQHKRDLPWRVLDKRPDPYPIWVSEIMLQQTQVKTVLPYFKRFMQTLPTVSALAGASDHVLLKLWEGLGYYNRARHMHAAAKIIALSGWPKTYDALQALPGLGFYTAAAVASIAFKEPVPVVDGNVIRVITRLAGLQEDSTTQQMKQTLFNRLKPLIQDHDPAVFNQALMELGALLCSPKQPQCHACPVASYCVARKQNCINKIPNRPKKKPVPHYTIGVGVIYRDNKILIGKRKANQMLGGLWEFPGGKQQPPEPIVQTVIREVKEETGLDIRCTACIAIVKHAYTHFKITVHAYRCVCDSDDEPIAHTTDALHWVDYQALDAYPFPTASRKIIRLL